MDCVGNHVLVASHPLDLQLLQLDAAHGRLVPVRELSMFSVGRPLLGLAVVPPHAPLSAAAAPSAPTGGGGGGGADAEAAALARALARGAAGPQHAVLLRWGGALSVLDLDRGSELLLSNEVGGGGAAWLGPCCARCVSGLVLPRVAGDEGASLHHTRQGWAAAGWAGVAM